MGSRYGIATVFTFPKSSAPSVRVHPLVLYGHRDAVLFASFCGKRGLVTMSSDGVLFFWRLCLNDGTMKELVDSDESRVIVPVGVELMSKHFSEREALNALFAHLPTKVLPLSEFPMPSLHCINSRRKWRITKVKSLTSAPSKMVCCGEGSVKRSDKQRLEIHKEDWGSWWYFEPRR